MKLNEKIYKLRKQKGWSQDDLSEKVGVSRQAISRWENGQALPELEKTKILAQIFEISLDELVNENEITNSNVENEKNENKRLQKDITIKKNRKIIFFLVFAVVISIFVAIVLYRYLMINLFCNRLNEIEYNNFHLEKIIADSSDSYQIVTEYIDYFYKDNYCKTEYLDPKTNNILKLEYEKLGEYYYNINLEEGNYKLIQLPRNTIIDYPKDIIRSEIRYALNLYPDSFKNKLELALKFEYKIYIDEYGNINITNSDQSNYSNTYNIQLNLIESEIMFEQFKLNEETKEKSDFIHLNLDRVNQITNEEFNLPDLSTLQKID